MTYSALQNGHPLSARYPLAVLEQLVMEITIEHAPDRYAALGESATAVQATANGE